MIKILMQDIVNDGFVATYLSLSICKYDIDFIYLQIKDKKIAKRQQGVLCAETRWNKHGEVRTWTRVYGFNLH